MLQPSPYMPMLLTENSVKIWDINIFCMQGRFAKDKTVREVLRNGLSKERSTRLKCCFGTQKQHYSYKNQGTE